jgi:serine/threonine protein kinase
VVESASPGDSKAIISALMTLAPGSKLGPYEIVGPLGPGGMGEVYRARDTRLDRDVAIKIFLQSFPQIPHASNVSSVKLRSSRL